MEASITRFFPNAAHSFCVYHLEKNVKARFHTTVNGLLFTAAKAPNVNDFNVAMDAIDQLHHGVGKYIGKVERTKWARAFFPVRRFGHVTSNISESMNWWLEEARHHEPVGLFCIYIQKVNRLFEKRRNKYSSMRPNELPKKVAEMYNASDRESRTLNVRPHSGSVFEVQSLNDPQTFRVVNLETPECSCGFYKEQGVPCRHMFAAALFVRENPLSFVIPQRRLETLKATYVGTTMPVDLRLLQDNGLKPPVETKRRGRPKKNRIPSTAENGCTKTITLDGAVARATTSDLVKQTQNECGGCGC